MTEDKINVRVLQDADLSDWLRLRKQLWDELSDDEHRAEMTGIYQHADTQLVLVAENGRQELVGFLEASIRPFVEDCNSENVGYLEGWFVEENSRRNGVGRRLVRLAENWAKSKGCAEMASDSEIGNELSLRAHLDLGYVETSRLVHLRRDLD